MLWLLAACTSPGPSGPTGPVDDTDPPTEDTGPPEPAQWVFEPIEGMKCGDGSPTGIGISEGTNDDELLVFFVGGGACWDLASCYVLESATNIQGTWDDVDLQAETGVLAASGLAQRNDPTLAYQDATWVYVPYCTGDLQVGNQTNQYEPVFFPDRLTHHVGDANVSLVLDHLASRQPSLDRLWMVGVSAGGYAAQLQAHRFQARWPSADLSVYADAAPIIQPGEGRWPAWVSSWQIDLPDDCGDCGNTMPGLFDHRVASTPSVDYALNVASFDPVITLFFAQPLGGLTNTLDAMEQARYRNSNQLSIFRVDTDQHGMLEAADTTTTTGGVVLRDWFTDWAAGEALNDTP